MSPVQNCTRKIPHAVDEKLKSLKEYGVIGRVDTPTPWTSNLTTQGYKMHGLETVPRNLRVPENHPCCAYMDCELVSLLLTRTNMTWMLIPVDGFQGCSSKFSDLLYGKLFRRFRFSKLK